jgi:hypothetical protein
MEPAPRRLRAARDRRHPRHRSGTLFRHAVQALDFSSRHSAGEKRAFARRSRGCATAFANIIVAFPVQAGYRFERLCSIPGSPGTLSVNAEGTSPRLGSLAGFAGSTSPGPHAQLVF